MRPPSDVALEEKLPPASISSSVSVNSRAMSCIAVSSFHIGQIIPRDVKGMPLSEPLRRDGGRTNERPPFGVPKGGLSMRRSLPDVRSGR